jgi:hypothetical protein
MEAQFSVPAYFNSSTFSVPADFIYAKFSKSANFSSVKFLNEVHFSEAEDSRVFNGETLFVYAIFEQPALYYNLSRYGEDLLRPTLIGIVIVLGSTLIWLTQTNPNAEPSFFTTTNSHNYSLPELVLLARANQTHHTYLPATTISSKFIGLDKVANYTQWQKAFERSFADFLPLLSLGSDIKVDIIDFIIKIVGGALTFGLLAIALRRKFERKYTR